MLKKLVSLLICIQMLACCFTTAFAEHGEDSADITPATITNQMITLTALGVYTENDCNNSGNMLKRGDFARMIYNFAIYSACDDEVRYNDIDEKEAAYVNYAVERGYLEGYSDGSFKPEQTATVFQIIKAIIIELGYEELAKYYNGYINAAMKINLVSSVADNSAEISYNDAAELFYKALLTGKGEYALSGDAKFEVSEKRYIQERFDADILRGIVQGTQITAFGKAGGCGTDTVVISGQSYKCNIDLDNYLGCRVDYVVKETDGEETVIAIFGEDKHNSVINISAENIISFEDNVYK